MDAVPQQDWTQDGFLAWAGRQEGRFEFDGVRPVAMTGGSSNHNVITLNIVAALRSSLTGSAFKVLGLGAGIETVPPKVRYPDVIVTAATFRGSALIVPGPVVLFEVVSANSAQQDRIGKAREYAAIPTVRRYVLVESTAVGVTVLSRGGADEPWTAITLMDDDVLELPEMGVSIPLPVVYAESDFD